MKRLICPFAVLVVLLNCAVAQTHASYQPSLRILAVMADFQTDKDQATTGNGKFGSMYSKDYGTKILDPLPHGQGYFEAHLLFAKNYFNRVSGGKLKIEYTVIPQVVTLTKAMREYSPDNKSTDMTLLGNFAKEVWAKTASDNAQIKFSDYDLFIVFHAGVGREIPSVGSFGNERDLPSIYMGDNLLRTMFGSDITGLPLNSNGKVNSMIIPETENRELSAMGVTELQQISINGLMVSNIGSHLGLPDLYDTKTGLSAIGRFGLMDGQAIFTYSGTFPPAPSAWEKIFLGWTNPVTVNPVYSEKKISLTASSAAAAKDTVILKVPVSPNEYFLIENRQRDALKNYCTVKYLSGGDTITTTLQKDTTGFYSYNADTLKGVVIDVDDYDWALPGNGVVIWHIDEDIINSKIAANEINADKDNRGIFVAEADGIRDIGIQYTTIFGDEIVGEGTDEDFWYSGNKSKLYKNEFNDGSLPSAKSNSGANSLIDIKDFSAAGPVMTFNIKKGNSSVQPLFVTRTNIGGSTGRYLSSIQASDRNYFILRNGESVIILDGYGNKISEIPYFSSYDPLCRNIGGVPVVVGGIKDKLKILTIQNGVLKSDSLIVNLNSGISSFPVLVYQNNTQQLAFASVLRGETYYYSFVSNAPYLVYSGSTINSILPGNRAIASDTSSSVICLASGKDFVFGESIVEKPGITSLLLLKRQLSNTSDYYAVAADTTGIITLIKDDKTISTLDIRKKGEENIAVDKYKLSGCDLKGDGNPYLLCANGKYLDVFNLQGASADNFPYKDTKGKGFTGIVLSADFTGDDAQELISVTADGRIFAFDGKTGAVVDGFPLVIGSSLNTKLDLSRSNDGIVLTALNDSGYFYAWKIGDKAGKICWSRDQGSAGNSSFASAVSSGGTSAAAEFMPKEKTYNWPNPVYNGSTNIRFYVSEDSKINVKIFDLVGGYVANLSGNAKGAMDNEIAWDVSNIQSGVYLARVEATGASGKSETRVIKIAVMK